ncbi:MAG: hypothetical protein V4547_17220 [Bacteroidota bacterium]
MKKILTHNGMTFNLKLSLNYNVERRMGGKVEHLLNTYGEGEGNDWNKAYMIDDTKMKEQIELAEQDIIDFANGGKKTTPQQELAASLGFE